MVGVRSAQFAQLLDFGRNKPGLRFDVAVEPSRKSLGEFESCAEFQPDCRAREKPHDFVVDCDSPRTMLRMFESVTELNRVVPSFDLSSKKTSDALANTDA